MGLIAPFLPPLVLIGSALPTTLLVGASGAAAPAPAAPPVYATWNPADKAPTVTLSNGNLTATVNSSGSVRATIGKSAGKWYWEYKSVSGNNNTMGGIANASANLELGGGLAYPGGDINGWGMYWFNGNKYNNAVGAAYASAIAFNVIVGVRLDMDAGTLSYSVGGVDKGVAFSGLSGTLFPAIGGGGSPYDETLANFGATAFTYAVPDGYNAGIYT